MGFLVDLTVCVGVRRHRKRDKTVLQESLLDAQRCFFVVLLLFEFARWSGVGSRRRVVSLSVK